MKYFLWLVGASCVLCAEQAVVNSLDQLKWKNRVLIIWSDQVEQDWRSINDRFGDQILDRDMIIFVIDQSTIQSNAAIGKRVELFNDIKNRFTKDQGRFFLIGKDGGLKSSGYVLDMSLIFSKIDQMPMRQLEMKHQHP